MPAGGLPCATRVGGVLEPVVERVAHEVDERIAERVDDRPVEFGVATDEVELDVLAELRREVAHEPREAHEDDVDRNHPDLHHHRLQRLRAARQVLHRMVELRRARCWPCCASTAVRWIDELAHQVHERVEPLGVDADGATVCGAALGGRCAGVRALRLCLLERRSAGRPSAARIGGASAQRLGLDRGVEHDRGVGLGECPGDRLGVLADGDGGDVGHGP